jgi:hypothetical protein
MQAVNSIRIHPQKNAKPAKTEKNEREAATDGTDKHR